MDEKNGEVFDHHAELFAQIGSVSENDSLRDFMLNPSDLIEPTGTAKTIPVPATQIGSTPQDNMWVQGYSCSEPPGLLLNHNRSGFNLPLSVPPLEILPNEVENTSALLDNLVKSIPASENVLDQYTSPSLPNKNLSVNCRSAADNSNHMSNPLFGGLYRISSDKVTQDFLDNFNKLESSDMLIKCSEYENLAWNGLICDPINNINFQSQNQLTHGLQSSVDKNGNSALFGSSHIDKISSSNSSEHFPQNNFMARLSPSASVETSVRTPATSYESASPLSNNRTPIRSDESISPMGSGHTPLRVEESTSPLTNIKTPLRIEEGSPMGRTPLRVEESFSPVGSGSSFLTSNSPSHKTSAQTQGFDSYSPPSIFKRTEAKSPTSSIHPVSCKLEHQESTNKKEEKEPATNETKISEEKGIKTGKVVCSASKLEESKSSSKNLSSVLESDATTSAEALIKLQTNKKLPIPFVSAQRIDDPIVSRKSVKRTLSRKSDSELYCVSSSMSRESESDLQSLATNEACIVKTEFSNVVPEVEKNKLSDDAQKMSQAEDITFSEEFFNKSKKRRKKTENLCLPNIKRRNRKRVTIYQSSMSPEETGIKLKIKVASAFQRIKPQKKRKSKKQYGSDEEEDSGSKRSKKIVRFSNSTRESETSEQTEWGDKIPPQVLQRIFEFVVEEQGCVPSLVR